MMPFNLHKYTPRRKCCWCRKEWRDHNEERCGNAAGTTFTPARLKPGEHETNCKECGQPMKPKGVRKKPNEYDHASGCPLANIQPMSTAPKDREIIIQHKNLTRVLAHYMPGGHCIEDHPPIDEGFYFYTGIRFEKVVGADGWFEL